MTRRTIPDTGMSLWWERMGVCEMTVKRTRLWYWIACSAKPRVQSSNISRVCFTVMSHTPLYSRFYHTFITCIKGIEMALVGWILHIISYVFSCDQAALWMVFSVRPSVCLSVRLSVTPFWLCSHHRIIMKFSGVIINDKSDVHAKGQGQRSKVKVTKVNTQLNRFRTVTPVWIHIWWWNDAYSLMMLRKGALLFLKVIHQISRSHGSKKCRIWPKLGVSGL